MIKSVLTFTCLSTILFVSVPAFADDYYHFETCKEKTTEIEQKISYEQQYKKQYKIDKLEKKLNYIKANCKDADLQKGYQYKVDQKQAKVTEKTEEFKQAQQTGKTSKTADKKENLHKAQIELTAAQKALDIFKSSAQTN